LIFVANDIRKKHGSSYIVKELYNLAKQKSQNSIIESIRCVGEVIELKKLPKFILLAVDADIKIRYERILKRKSSKDNVSFEEFKNREELEMSSTDENKQNIKKCIELSDFQIDNNSTIADLHKKIDEIIK